MRPSTKNEFPRLSVPQPSVTYPVASRSLLHSSVGSSTITPTRAASSSSDAMVRKGSPRWNAHGADRLVNSRANHGASPALRPSSVSYPPMATLSPSAFASAR